MPDEAKHDSYFQLASSLFFVFIGVKQISEDQLVLYFGGLHFLPEKKNRGGM